jgi:hypothetical protein
MDSESVINLEDYVEWTQIVTNGFKFTPRTGHSAAIIDS